DVSTIGKYMIKGTIDDLISDPNGIIIGAELARRMSLTRGRNLTIATTTGQVRVFKVVGIFRTGRSGYDNGQTFINLKRVQALLNRANRANRIIVKLD